MMTVNQAVLEPLLEVTKVFAKAQTEVGLQVQLGSKLKDVPCRAIAAVFRPRGRHAVRQFLLL